MGEVGNLTKLQTAHDKDAHVVLNISTAKAGRVEPANQDDVASAMTQYGRSRQTNCEQCVGIAGYLPSKQLLLREMGRALGKIEIPRGTCGHQLRATTCGLPALRPSTVRDPPEVRCGVPGERM
jgi:hypothetical protein